MSIVCDTDFSPGAQQAGCAAAILARRRGEKLYLVHVVDELGSELMLGGDEDAMLDPEREMLQRETEALRRLGARVEPRLVAGCWHLRLAEIAGVCRARLIVISRHRESWLGRLFGGSVEKLVWVSCVPVLVTAGSERLMDWLRGERALLTLIGLDDSDGSRSALRWLGELGHAGPLETRVVTLRRTLEPERLRTGALSRIAAGGSAHPYRDEPPLEDASARSEIVTRRPAPELLRLARQEHVDLLVIARDLAQGRVWRLPAWQEVVRSSLSCSVVCVPEAFTPAEASKPRSSTSLLHRVRRGRLRMRSVTRCLACS